MHATVTCAQCHANNNYVHHANCLLFLPPGGFHRRNDSQSRPRQVSRQIARYATQPMAGVRRHSITRRCIPLDRGAHQRSLRAVPHEQQLHDAANRLATAATRPTTQERQIPDHVSSGFPDHLRHLPQHIVLDQCDIQPQQHGISAHRCAHHRSCAQCHTNNNYTTLPTTCYGCHQADFTGTTNPNHVSAGFPTDCTLCHTTSYLDHVHVQSCFGLPADWCSCHGRVRAMPHQQQLHNVADNLLWLPPDGLHRDDESQSRRRGVPNNVRYLPQHHGLDRGHVQSRYLCQLSTDRFPRDADMRSVPYQQQLHKHADRMLLRATRRTSLERPIPITSHRASRQIAPSATQRPPGVHPRLTTTPRRFR